MEQHSTLEVHEVEDSHPFDYHGAKKEAPFRPDSYPERIPLEIDRSGVYSPEVAQPVAQESTTQEPTRRICGLPNRIFYLVLAAALLVVIGAIAGGVAGGLSSKKNHNTGLDGSHEDPHEPDPDNNLPGDSTPPTHPNVNILKESRLASSNGTDYNGNTYRMVFFQDTHGAVIVRRWDSQSNSWATSNITDALGSSSTPLNPMKGTPLATSSIPYDYGSEVDLWFIVPDSSISAVQLLSPGDAHIDQWQYELLDGNDSQKTQPGSQLTATWQSCWGGNCTGYWLTAFQHPSGNIFVVNGSDPDTMTLMVESRAVATNSSLSLIPAYPGTFYLISESPGSTGDIYLNDYVESDGGWDIGSSSEFPILSTVSLIIQRLNMAISN